MINVARYPHALELVTQMMTIGYFATIVRHGTTQLVLLLSSYRKMSGFVQIVSLHKQSHLHRTQLLQGKNTPSRQHNIGLN